MDEKKKELWTTDYWKGLEEPKLMEDAYKALEDIVGPEYISDDPAVTQGYTLAHLAGIPALQAMGFPRVRPPAIVLPGSTEDVQAILRVCNRYKVNFFPICTGAIFLPPTRSCIIMDFKRMRRILDIDEKNMFAVVEPYVTHAQLQAELMKRGLIHNTPGAGSQCAVLPNYVWSNGSGGLIHRTGSNGQRGALGVEWVLPDGEILRLGSLGIPGAGWFDGDGPGPNLRGMIKGYVGHNGGMGVATKVAIKAWPWPGPREFPTTGMQE
ncbi:MAG: FAD-binding oxidoreductase, partial [Deltaproteobacteria bacterium]|nr:FAD-binding oxidoreductase [Deltaproteobacteria bacterium]